MAVAQVVDARVNPSNPAQRVVLWGNGRIDTFNSAKVTDAPEFFNRVDQPVVVAIHIADWTTMAGYVLDKQGGFHPFNGAPAVGTKSNVYPTDTHYIVTNVPYWPTGIYKDWSWDPNNPGRGVVLDGFGTLHAFGGAPLPPRIGHRWPASVFRKLQMQWSPSVKAYSIDYAGRIHADYAAAPIAPYFYFNGDMAVDFQITNWTNGGGYMLDRNGGIWVGGGVQWANSPSYKLGADRARILRILSPSNPLRLWELWAGGQEIEWVASTPPTVTAGGYDPLSPASTVSDTTRPVLAWAYTDAQNDQQARVLVLVFTAAYVASHNMADALSHSANAVVYEEIFDPTVRGIASPVDLVNGNYRLYVAAQDTADQWSPWSNRAWTQNVPLPATPTGLTATPNSTTATVALSVTATTGGVATLVRFECSDDAGVTWAPVVGASALPIAATVSAVDRFPPQGKPRTYRAVAYAIDPRTASLPSATKTATVAASGYFITAVDVPEAGGLLRVQEPVRWERYFSVGVFEGLGAKYPTVVRDGNEPRASKGTVNLLSVDEEAWAKIASLATSGSTLVYRDPFGGVRFCELVGNWPQELISGSAMQHRHVTELPLVEVRPPNLAA